MSRARLLGWVHGGSRRVAIIGGGAIGSAIAYWLTADPAFGGEVVVVERDPAYARASSALSASSIRQQFSTPVNIAIGLFGIGFLRGIGEHAGRGRRAARHRPGRARLPVPGDRAGTATLRANHAVQARARGRCRAADAGRAAPPLPLARRSRISPAPRIGRYRRGLVRRLRPAARLPRQGRSLRVRATSPPRPWASTSTGGRIVACPPRRRRQRLACDVVVNAAGPWAARVAAMAGRRSAGAGAGALGVRAWRARPPCPAARWSSTPRASGSAPRAATSSPAPRPVRARIHDDLPLRAPTTRCSRR